MYINNKKIQDIFHGDKMISTIFKTEDGQERIIYHISDPEVPDPVDESRWGRIVTALENCTPEQFDNDALSYSGTDPQLTIFALG